MEVLYCIPAVLASHGNERERSETRDKYYNYGVHTLPLLIHVSVTLNGMGKKNSSATINQPFPNTLLGGWGEGGG